MTSNLDTDVETLESILENMKLKLFVAIEHGQRFPEYNTEALQTDALADFEDIADDLTTLFTQECIRAELSGLERLLSAEVWELEPEATKETKDDNYGQRQVRVQRNIVRSQSLNTIRTRIQALTKSLEEK
jgi:division protein CdvB (Snf7/Vps24/ESCRT-III family)